MEYKKFSKKKGMSKEDKKQASLYNEYIKKNLGKHYRDSNEFKVSKADIKIKALKFGTIASHKLIKVSINGDIIQLKNSWIELLLIMISSVMSDNPNDFKTVMCNNKITNSNFLIDNMYGKYNLDNSEKQNIYKIFDTGYYLEILEEPEVIFMALIHLIKYLEIDIETFVLSVENKNKIEVEKHEKEERGEIITVGTEEAREMFKENIHLMSVELFGNTVALHRIEIVLLAFCNCIVDKYGVDRLLTLENNDGTGICINTLSTDKPSARIGSSIAYVYTDSDIDNIIDFIEDAINELEVDGDNEIKFTFRGKCENKKEWEVD